jgi:hypothetical protein
MDGLTEKRFSAFPLLCSAFYSSMVRHKASTLRKKELCSKRFSKKRPLIIEEQIEVTTDDDVEFESENDEENIQDVDDQIVNAFNAVLLN